VFERLSITQVLLTSLERHQSRNSKANGGVIMRGEGVHKGAKFLAAQHIA